MFVEMALSRARCATSPLVLTSRLEVSGCSITIEPFVDSASMLPTTPATLTRAMQRLREISAEELEGCPEEVHRPFASSLFEFLAA